MKKNFIIFGTLIVAAIGLYFFWGNNSYERISADQAVEMMLASEEIVILDVRTKEEFTAGHIENAILLPANEIREQAEIILPDKNVTILIYCFSGNRSANVARELAAMGYTNVYDFGGIINWRGEITQ